ncbi:MAG TPA: hypothetical protein VF727_07925 [Allosphingosinicella sp.]
MDSTPESLPAADAGQRVESSDGLPPRRGSWLRPSIKRLGAGEAEFGPSFLGNDGSGTS